MTITLKSYKTRLEQLNSGHKEIYEGEKQLITEIIKRLEKGE